MIGRVGCVVLVFTASFCFTFVMSLYAGFSSEWNYSRAASCAQQEKWTDAQKGMSQLMVDNPDDAALLYDSGIVAYRMKEFETAEAYFGQTICCDGVCDTLKKQTYFNLGNTKVALKKLTDAIEAYESVLAIDPDDERAKHNLEVVRQMLQQQQQDDKNNQQNQPDNKQDKDKQSQNQNQDQEQQSSADEQKQDGANDDAQQQSQSTDTQEQKGKQKNDGEMNDSQSGGQPEENQSSDEQKEGDRKGDASDESNTEGCDQDQKQLSSHDSSPPKDSEQTDEQKTRNSNFQNTHREEKEQEMQAGTIDDVSQQEDMRQQQHKKLEQELAPHERWMARVLQQRDAADEHANKRMVKAAIDKELAGKDGQNCW